MWTLDKSQFWAERVMDWWVEDDTPVLVHSIGSYPHLTADDGRTTKDVTYVAIRLHGTSKNGVDYWDGISVSVVDNAGCGYSRIAWSDKFEKTVDPNAMIAEAKKHVRDAICVVDELRASVVAAKKRLAEGDMFTSLLSREQYEKACVELGVDALTDDECDSYGVKYGDFRYPQYSPDYVLKMKLARLRLWAISAESKASAEPDENTNVSNKPPRQTGQIWEPCPKCGQEPVYLPLMVCDTCWPEP